MSWKWGTNWFKKAKIQNLIVRQLLNTVHQVLIKDNQKIFSSQDLNLQTFKRQPDKMVKHTQTIPWLTADELFECVWPFCGVGTQRVHHRHQAIGKPSELMFCKLCFSQLSYFCLWWIWIREWLNMRWIITEAVVWRCSIKKMFLKFHQKKFYICARVSGTEEILAQKCLWEFCEIFKNIFCIEHFWWLLLPFWPIYLA